MPPKPPFINFDRSYLYFSTDRVRHTPRMLVEAICTIEKQGEAARLFALTCECIGEAMYVHTGLIHDPAFEFNLIAEPDGQILMLKRHGDGALDQRIVSSVGQVMPTRDGKGSLIVSLKVHLAPATNAVAIQNASEFRDALLNHRPITARTTWVDADTQSTITLDYPARTTNIAHEEELWQVDAGPVLMPVDNPAKAGPLVATLDLAHIVFNRWDYAEAVVRRTAAVHRSYPEHTTSHFQSPRGIHCTNQLYTHD